MNTYAFTIIIPFAPEIGSGHLAEIAQPMAVDMDKILDRVIGGEGIMDGVNVDIIVKYRQSTYGNNVTFTSKRPYAGNLDSAKEKLRTDLEEYSDKQVGGVTITLLVNKI